MSIANHIKLSIYVRHALQILGVRFASGNSGWVMKNLNPIAKCNLLEGAFGIKQDALAGETMTVNVGKIMRNLERLEIDLSAVDPEMLEFDKTNAGPLTHKMLDEVAKYVEGSRHDGYMGIESDMFATGLWRPEMLPGGNSGFMNTGTDSFWWSIGRKYGARIRSGKFGMRDAIGITRKKLLALAKNHQDSAQRRDNDFVDNAEGDTYLSGRPADPRSLIAPYFDALDNPSHNRHNRAKEFWAQAMVPSLAPNALLVFEAFRHLGATDKGGISGGYQAAADWINERSTPNERPISTKGVKKAWEKVKAQLAVKFETAFKDSRWADLWEGLADDAGLDAMFSQTRGLQMAPKDTTRGLSASIANRHAYRQLLRQRATKTAGFQPPRVNKSLAKLVAKSLVDKHWSPSSLKEISSGIAKGILKPMSMSDLIDNQDAVKAWAYGLPREDLLNIVRWVYETNFRGRKTQYSPSEEYLSRLS